MYKQANSRTKTKRPIKKARRNIQRTSRISIDRRETRTGAYEGMDAPTVTIRFAEEKDAPTLEACLERLAANLSGNTLEDPAL